MAVTPGSDPSCDSRTRQLHAEYPAADKGPEPPRANGDSWGGFWPLSGSYKGAVGPFGHAALGLSWL
ncbi:hypothetical protein TrVFT333_008059 [Trichoderma virens FT-333]|nr:hypothetical protein TrVFT333_008059 [Trichoderma virens FT-333]